MPVCSARLALAPTRVGLIFFFSALVPLNFLRSRT